MSTTRTKKYVKGLSSKEGTHGKKPLFPKGIPFIVGNEGAERFSFYGMRAILYVYLTSLYLQFQPEIQVAADVSASAKAHATQVVHLFMAGVYAFPMIGAIMADRLFGKYNVILWVSLIYCAGHGVLAFAGRMGALGQLQAAEMGMYIGLALIAVGSGGIKPCVSANVGDQFTKENSELVGKVYQIFYFIINFGSFFSTLLIPYLKRNYGAEVAFGVPGILMGLATLIFWFGRNRFTKIPPKPGGKLGLLDLVSSVLFFLPVMILIFSFFAGKHEGQNLGWSQYIPHVILSILSFSLGLYLFSLRQKKASDNGFIAQTLYCISHRKQRKKGESFFTPAVKYFGAEAAEGPPAVLRIILVFSMVTVFWALFDQHSSTWIEQAKQMDLSLQVPEFFGKTLLVNTILLALYGGAALFLWISNINLNKKLSYGILVLAGASVLGALMSDLWSGRYMTLNLEASQISALNPLMVMFIIPLLNIFLYNKMEQRGTPLSPLKRMTVGMFLTAVSFAVAALLQQRVEEAALVGQKISILWQTIQYFIITISEVMVSVTALEFAYTQAPRSMKSTIMGFWLLCTTFGNVLVAFLAPLQKSYSLSSFFGLFATMMLGAAIVFSILAYFYKGKTYLAER